MKPARCSSTRRLDGMVTIVTGANAGLGKETVVDLAERGRLPQFEVLIYVILLTFISCPPKRHFVQPTKYKPLPRLYML